MGHWGRSLEMMDLGVFGCGGVIKRDAMGVLRVASKE